MMIFNVETHGDIRFCPICRRYIVTIANSPHPVARPFISPYLARRRPEENFADFASQTQRFEVSVCLSREARLRAPMPAVTRSKAPPQLVGPAAVPNLPKLTARVGGQL